MATTIPDEIKQEIKEIIDEFNNKYFKGRLDKVSYFAGYKGKFLYLTIESDTGFSLV